MMCHIVTDVSDETHPDIQTSSWMWASGLQKKSDPYNSTIQNLFAALFGPFGQAVPQLAHVCHWAIMPVWQHV